MPGPLFLSESFFDTTLFTGHTVTAESDVTGNEPFRVGNARRHETDFWQPSADNTATWIQVELDKVRAFDTVFLDRGHNLGGETITLQGSGDGSTFWDIFSVTVPSSVASPGDLRNALGVKTEEGAFCRQFDTESAKYVRLRVPAMGANLRPKIVGLYVGLAFVPAFPASMPWAPGGTELLFDVNLSDRGWMGTSDPANRGSTEINLQLESFAEYDLARYHLESLAFRGKVTWFIGDLLRSERAKLMRVPPGNHAFRRERGWGYWQSRFPMVEEAPLQTWEAV